VVTSFAHDVPLIDAIPAAARSLEELQGRSLAYKYRAQQMNKGGRGRKKKKTGRKRNRNREKNWERK
jgi:hypothetical protein